MNSIDSDEDMSYSFFVDKSSAINIKKPKEKDKNIPFGETPPAPTAIFTRRTREKWVEDNSSEKCNSCKSTFRIYRRLHHCIIEGTNVTLSNGMAKKIEDVYVEEKIPSWDSKNNNIDNNSMKVEALLDQGDEPCLKIILEDGRELITTSDHEILVVTPDNSNPEYIQMKDLTTSHRVVCSVLKGVLDDSSLDKNEYIIPGTPLSILQEREKCLAFARLCGYALTDGSLSENSNRIVFLMGDFDDVEAMCHDIELLIGYKIDRPELQNTGKAEIYRVEFSNKKLRTWFEDAGITTGNKVNKGMKIPKFMWDDNCPKSIQREFIGGWFGGDGSRFGISNQKNLKTNYHLISVSLEGKDAKEIMINTNLAIEKFNKIINDFGIKSEIVMTKGMATVKGLTTPTSNSPQQLRILRTSEGFIVTFDSTSKVLDILNKNKNGLSYLEIFSMMKELNENEENNVTNFQSALTKSLQNRNLFLTKIENNEEKYYITEDGIKRLNLVNKWIDAVNDKNNLEINARFTTRIGFNINIENMIKFNEKIGFRYCIDKQSKMEIGTSYENYRKRLAFQRTTLINLALDYFLEEYPEYKDPRNEKTGFLQGTPTFKKCLNSLRKAEEYGKLNNFDSNVIINEKYKGFTKIVEGKRRTYEAKVGKVLTSSSTMSVKDFLQNTGFNWDAPSRFGKRYFTLKIVEAPKTYKNGKSFKVYDLSVPENTSFIANGIVVHNCRYCGDSFCDYCTQYREKIPRIIKKIPTRSGKEEPIDYKTPVRLCLSCHTTFLSIYKIEKLFTVFSLLKLDLQDLKTISLVCKQWNLMGAFYLSKFREIQYKLPNYSYNSWEKQTLWVNRLILKNHSIWEVHVLKSLTSEPEKFSEVVNIYFGTNVRKKIKPEIAKKIKEIKECENKKECWFRMCSRYCKRELDPERALILLDVLKVESASTNIVAKEINKTFNNLSDYNLECYLPYILYKLVETSNETLKEFIFERCFKSLRIANCCYWYFKINCKKYLSELSEKIPDSTITTIFKAENFINLIRCDDDIEGKIISVVKPELGEQKVFKEKIHIKESATRPKFIPLDQSSILFKKDDIRKDYVVICVIRLMEKILKDNGLDINIVTYNVQPTSESDGVIDIVENCETLYSLSEKLNTNIINYLLRNNPNESVINLRNRFKESCAFYSVVAFLLSISDRNTENLMVTSRGDFLNIDFNQIMGENTKPLKTSCVRITYQMLDALGGEKSKEYEEFNELCGEIYSILRRHVNTFICLLSLVIENEKMYLEIIKRFCPGETHEDALKNIKNRVDNSVENLSFSRYYVIDFFHKYSKESSIGNFFGSSYSNSTSYLSSMYSYLYNGK